MDRDGSKVSCPVCLMAGLILLQMEHYQPNRRRPRQRHRNVRLTSLQASELTPSLRLHGHFWEFDHETRLGDYWLTLVDKMEKYWLARDENAKTVPQKSP